MSTKLKEKQERVNEIIESLAEESSRGTLIVVEGRKDFETLRALNISGPIFTLKTGGKSFDQAASEIELIGALQVILLLDFDRRGREGTKRLKQDLEHLQVKVDLSFWQDLSSLLGRNIQCIEGLPSYLNTLEKKLM